MSKEVRFYFEFISPYSYLASLQIEAAVAATGSTILWSPVELIKVWQTQDVLEPYLRIRALKAPHIWIDAARSAARMGAILKRPSAGQMGDTRWARLAYWGLLARGDDRATPFLHAMWRRHFVDGGEIVSLPGVAAAAAPLGLREAELEAAASDPIARVRQDASNAEAVASRCFGVPWFLVGDNAFFGHDRIAHLDEHLRAASAI